MATLGKHLSTSLGLPSRGGSHRAQSGEESEGLCSMSGCSDSRGYGQRIKRADDKGYPRGPGAEPMGTWFGKLSCVIFFAVDKKGVFL